MDHIYFTCLCPPKKWFFFTDCFKYVFILKVVTGRVKNLRDLETNVVKEQTVEVQGGDNIHVDLVIRNINNTVK